MKKVPVKCDQCNSEFLKSKSELGRTNHNFCNNKCCREFNNNRHKYILPKLRKKRYYDSPKECLNCKTVIPYEKRHYNSNFCGNRCAAIYTQKNGGNRKWTEEEKKRQSLLTKNNPKFCGWNKGIKQQITCLECGSLFDKYPNASRKFCSRKCSSGWMKRTGYLKGKTGGYRRKGGRGKQGWYKGYYCNSSWELAWVIYNLEHGIKFKRNTKGFEYEFNGESFKFYPDFILENGDYVEVKSYIDKKNERKIASFPHKLMVVGREEIKPFIDYAEEIHGKDFIKLYDPKKTS